MLLPWITISLLALQSPSGDSLSLHDAVARALSHRGQVRAASAAVARARAEHRAAGLIANPTASYSYTDDPPRQHATIQQSFDWLLRRGTDRSAAQAATLAAEADSAVTTSQVAADTRLAFYRVLAANETLVLLGAQTDIADSLSAIARERLAKGDISQLESDQLSLEAARAHQALSRGREEHAAALADFTRQIAWPDSLPVPELAGRLEDGLDSLTTPPRMDEARIPSIQGRVADSVAAIRRHRSAGLARIPVPAVEVGVDWNDPTLPAGTQLLVVGVSVPIPLWNVGGSDVAIARANALEAAARASEARSEFLGRSNETRIRITESARRARVALDSLLPAARRLRERTAQGYRLGEIGIIPLLDALRVERETAVSLVDELLSFQQARATWNSLIGVTE